jgi:hypothetical protein
MATVFHNTYPAFFCQGFIIEDYQCTHQIFRTQQILEIVWECSYLWTSREQDILCPVRRKVLAIITLSLNFVLLMILA